MTRTFWKAACGAALAVWMAACAAPHKGLADRAWVYVGSDGPQLRLLGLDAGRLSPAALPAADALKPRWFLPHPTLPLGYAAIDGSGKEGSIITYAIERDSGVLTRRAETPSGGSGTTYLGFDAQSNTLLAANFASGSASTLPLQDDGNAGAVVSTVKATGSGPHRRQGSPHAHGVSVDPSGRFALVADMGADRVFVYRFDRGAQALMADAGLEPFATPAGSGPRRAVFGASGRYVYVLNELTAEVMTLRWDAPKLTQIQSQAISSPDFKGNRSAAEIAVSRDGRFVYIADRGEATLLVYAVDARTGELTLLQRLPSGGEAPWAFDIDTSGRWLLVANFRSNRLNLFSIDPVNGRLSDTGQRSESPSPVSVSFVARP